jgi:hypothetical protein
LAERSVEREKYHEPVPPRPVSAAGNTFKEGVYTFPVEINNHGTNSSCKTRDCRMCQAKNLLDEARATRHYAALNDAQRKIHRNTELELIDQAYNLVQPPQERPKFKH